MRLTTTEIMQVRQVLQQSQWQTCERVAEHLIDQIKETSKVDDDEWKTLKNVLTAEGEIRGIRRFIQQLYEYAQKNE